MSTYGIKRAYQHTAETQPFAVNLCVASFLLTLCNFLVATRALEGGWDTGYGNAALGGTRPGPELQVRRSLLLIN